MGPEQGVVWAVRQYASQGAGGALASVADAVYRSLWDAGEAVANLLEAIASGVAMALHDAADFGLLDRLHHWLIGVVLVVAALLALILALLLW